MIFRMLEKQSSKEFEVIIADDGSNEQSVAYIQRLIKRASFPVQHVWHEDKGWRKNIILNKAVVASKAPYLVFIDGDCIPDCHFISDHLMLRQKGVVAACRRVQLSQRMTDEITPEKVEKGYLHYMFARLMLAGIHDCRRAIRIANPIGRKILKFFSRRGGLLGCNFGIYKEDLLRVNGFDERYLAAAVGEDTDLEMRLAQEGVITEKESYICRVYHRMHERNYPDNIFSDSKHTNTVIYLENKRNAVGYTPFGINKNV